MTTPKNNPPEAAPRQESIDHKRELTRMQERAERAETAAALLRAGLDDRWTDARVLSIFAGSELEDGWLGAVMALLHREEGRLIEEAYDLEEQRHPEALAGAVGAAKRLRFLRERLVRLYEQAHGAQAPGQRPKPRR